MHLIESPDTDLKIYLPENLSECDRQQYIDVCELLFQYHTSQISEAEFMNHCVYKLMNMKVGKSKNGDEAEKHTNVALLEELLQESFFFKDEQPDGTIKLNIIQNYIHNPVADFKPLWRKYYGPNDGFQNVKCGEYTQALKLFLEFNVTGEMELLYEFVATLYRPKKWFLFIRKMFPNYDGDCRQAYNQYHLKKRIAAFKYAPLGFIYGTYLYFASMQVFVSGAEVPWGDKTLDFSILFKRNTNVPEIEASDIGLDSVIFAMAESSAFGDFEKVQQLPFWTMMIKMYDSLIKQLQQEKIQENANSQQPS